MFQTKGTKGARWRPQHLAKNTSFTSQTSLEEEINLPCEFEHIINSIFKIIAPIGG